MGSDSVGETALALEEAAQNDEWFSSRNIYPNIDYWTAIVFHTLGFPQDMFPVWMMLPRIAGFIAHWQECLDDPEYKIFRPRQIYTGFNQRFYKESRAAFSPVLLDISNDPQAALRRTTGEPIGIGDVLSLIKRKEQEISLVKSEITKSNNSRDDLAETSDSHNPFLSMNWLTQSMAKNHSISELNKVRIF